MSLIYKGMLALYILGEILWADLGEKIKTLETNVTHPHS